MASVSPQNTWNPDYIAIFNKRMDNLRYLRGHEEDRKLVMDYYADGIKGCIAWINDICVTFDPRNEDPLPKLMPFVLFKRQEEFVEFILGCLMDKASGLVEKARDIGASWLCCAISVWLWLFKPGTAIGWGSLKEDAVDKIGDPKAIFTKMRQIIENLPEFMMPEGFNPRIHSSRMKLINPANGCSIIGEAGDNIGRGGRTSIYFKDESAHYEHPELIEAALGDNTNVQIDISSVNGTANVFYKRRRSGVVWNPGTEIPRGKTRVFIFDWRDHPLKTQEWYDFRKHKAEEEGLLHIFAQEIDRDYSGSVQGVIIPQIWVQAAIDAHVKLGFAAEGSKIGFQDIADGGRDRNALIMRHGVVAEFAKHWHGESGESAEISVPLCNEYGVSDLYYDCIGVGAGFKTQINNMKKHPSWNPRLKVFKWDAGDAPQNPDQRSIPGDAQSPLNKDLYKNLKAQAWYRVRARFYKTYLCIQAGKLLYPVDELISLSSSMPCLHELCLELSQPVGKQAGDGKTLVDKKPDSADSPNLADAFVGCYNPVKKLGVMDILGT